VSHPLDAADPLASYRDRFVGAETSLVYFDGNSLGRPLKVTGPRLAGRVRFYLHDTFPVSEYERKVAHRKATLTLGAYGAFTVGAIANDGRTPLELDLATVGPETFRER